VIVHLLDWSEVTNLLAFVMTSVGVIVGGSLVGVCVLLLVLKFAYTKFSGTDLTLGTISARQGKLDREKQLDLKVEALDIDEIETEYNDYNEAHDLEKFSHAKVVIDTTAELPVVPPPQRRGLRSGSFRR
jgi:hypothetical protein